ncbi:MAG: hypothetical protein H6843_03405 [Rhodospirillaceae bacterium]|nr:hypothetical protein [Rhodospirillaceae bacterium]
MFRALVIVPAVLAVFCANGLAALPPYWDSVRQVEAILASQDLGAQVHGAITSIRALRDLTFEVETTACRATVVLEAIPPDGPGATSYTVETVMNVICD